MNTPLCLESHHVLTALSFLDMSKKISKKANTVRTVSIAVGALSLLVIAFSQFTGNDACTSNTFSDVNHIRRS
tara:strand:- start:80 stop:298 length:219 start_codon:yes stop_codon:yes gene_type:complete